MWIVSLNDKSTRCDKYGGERNFHFLDYSVQDPVMKLQPFTVEAKILQIFLHRYYIIIFIRHLWKRIEHLLKLYHHQSPLSLWSCSLVSACLVLNVTWNSYAFTSGTFLLNKPTICPWFKLMRKYFQVSRSLMHQFGSTSSRIFLQFSA